MWMRERREEGVTFFQSQKMKNRQAKKKAKSGCLKESEFRGIFFLRVVTFYIDVEKGKWELRKTPLKRVQRRGSVGWGKTCGAWQPVKKSCPEKFRERVREHGKRGGAELKRSEKKKKWVPLTLVRAGGGEGEGGGEG